jgi:ubiquitin related modifier 1
MSSESPVASITLKVEFSGGLELLFSNQRAHTVTVPAVVSVNYDDASSSDTKPTDIAHLIHHLRDHLLKERVELFMEKGTVYARPSSLFALAI